MVPTKNSKSAIKKPKVSKKSSATKVKAIESTGKNFRKNLHLKLKPNISCLLNLKMR